ncbi:MAG: nucleoside-diphosphate kinase [Bacteroidales bacterium]
MSGKITLTMIKPHAVENGYIGSILGKINEAGFRIVALKYLKLSKDQAKSFYQVHQERSFFDGLTSMMSSGPIVAAILEKENAVEDFRKLIGATNPADAQEGTIRKLFGENIEKNAVHGSDSDENAQIEANFFFSKLERF